MDEAGAVEVGTELEPDPDDVDEAGGAAAEEDDDVGADAGVEVKVTPWKHVNFLLFIVKEADVPRQHTVT